MRSSTPFALLFAICAAIAVAQPVVNQGGILNAASYGLDSLPNAGIAEGSIFTVFGTGLGPATLQMAGAFPLSTTLGGTSIKVTAGGTTVDAIMLYTSASQVAAILPSKTPVGAGTLTLTYNAKPSSPVTIQVVRANFGIFARDMAGTGPAVVQNYVSQASMPFNSPIQAAQPGQVMVLWGTGLGPVNVDETNPPGAVDPGTDVEVWVGNQPAAVQYKGRSPGFSGEDQINFQLPQNVPQGCYVPVAIKAGGVVSNFTSIAIAPQGGICSDPHGPPASDLQRIASGQSLKLAWIQLVRENFTLGVPGAVVATGKADVAWGDFFRWDAGTVGQSVALNSVGGVALGSCTVVTGGENVFGSLVVRGGSRLNIGTALNLSGPNGSKRLPVDKLGLYEKNAMGYAATPAVFGTPKAPPFLDPGAYTVDNGTGGLDAGGFHASLTIPNAPTPLSWTNLDSIQTIDRSQDLTITWTGGDPTSEYVLIGGSVSLPTMQNPSTLTIFGCAERVDAGRFVIPSWVLSTQPINSTDPTASSFGVGRAPLLGGTKFTGNGLDAGYFAYSAMTLKNVTYK